MTSYINVSLGTEEQGNKEKSLTSTAKDTDGKESTGTLSLTLHTFNNVETV